MVGRWQSPNSRYPQVHRSLQPIFLHVTCNLLSPNTQIPARGKHQPLRAIGTDKPTSVQILGPCRLPGRKGDVVIEEDVGEHDLALSRGEEATGTRHFALSKRKAVGSCCRELMTVRIRLGCHSLVVEAEAVKLVGVGIDVRIAGYRVLPSDRWRGLTTLLLKVTVRVISQLAPKLLTTRQRPPASNRAPQSYSGSHREAAAYSQARRRGQRAHG